MHRSILINYISAYAEEGISIASVDVWPSCDLGDESSLSVAINRNQEPPIWLMRDGSGALIGRINVGKI